MVWKRALNVVSSIILLALAGTVLVALAVSFGPIDRAAEPDVDAPENTTGVPDVEASAHPDIDGERLEMDIFEAVNERRSAYGREPFVHSERVRLIARLHSKDMADRDFYDHRNPDGQGSEERHEEYGGCDSTNENIAYLTPRQVNETDDVAAKFVDMWANSPGHNRTMTSKYYQISAVGVYVTPKGEIYATQNFCREHPNA
jgi:uncharacterized protein YkwD